MRQSMRVSISVVALVVFISATSWCHAQCNRASRGRTGNTSSLLTGPNPFPATAGPFEGISGLSNFSNPALLAAQYAQNRMLAQRNATLQMMARQQFLAQQQRSQGSRDRGPSTTQATSDSRLTSREEVKNRLRQRNAEKAFRNAMLAESRGRTDDAETYFRRVLKILGKETELGQRASQAIAELENTQTPDDAIMLANRF